MSDNNLKINKKNKIETQPKLNEYLFSANVFVSLFCIISFIVLWRFLPQTIPAHWNGNWEIDRYGSRNEIFIHFILIIILLFSVSISYPILKRKPYNKLEIVITYITIAIIQIAYLVCIIASYDKYLTNAKSFYIWFSVELITCILLYAATIVSIVIQSIKKSQPIQSSN